MIVYQKIGKYYNLTNKIRIFKKLVKKQKIKELIFIDLAAKRNKDHVKNYPKKE